MNELLSPNESASNLDLVDGINKGFRNLRALTMALGIPRHLDEDAIATLANTAFTVNCLLEEKVDALLLRVGAITP